VDVFVHWGSSRNPEEAPETRGCSLHRHVTLHLR
jgi:hypothetical protein